MNESNISTYENLKNTMVGIGLTYLLISVYLFFSPEPIIVTLIGLSIQNISNKAVCYIYIIILALYLVIKCLQKKSVNKHKDLLKGEYSLSKKERIIELLDKYLNNKKYIKVNLQDFTNHEFYNPVNHTDFEREMHRFLDSDYFDSSGFPNNSNKYDFIDETIKLCKKSNITEFQGYLSNTYINNRNCVKKYNNKFIVSDNPNYFLVKRPGDGESNMCLYLTKYKPSSTIKIRSRIDSSFEHLEYFKMYLLPDLCIVFCTITVIYQVIVYCQ